MTAELEIVTDTLVLPIASIEEDPNQPRSHFDTEALEALADSIEDTAGESNRPWVDGLLHPIVVYPSPGHEEGGPGRPYRLLVGGRRLRAYQLRGWAEIPARVVPAPTSVARTLMTQLNENLARESTSLLEDALAVERAFNAWKDEHPNGRAKDFAAAFSRSPAWVSQHLALAKATGLARQALAEGSIRHAEAYRLFAQLDVETQRLVLYRARKNGTAITAAVVRGLAPRPASKPEAAGSAVERGEELPAPSSVEPNPGAELNPATEPEPDPELALTVRFAPQQLRWLLAFLGTEPPEDVALLPGALTSILDQLTHLDPEQPLPLEIGS
ncbi:MAG TPA: ParB/RepB/Spo0J family partition protein [Thermoanaerobaculia bacterium]|nr:ParB/RepB/Spo0J family partition protein [Thermoanaerobaculia bacterium]